MAGDVSRPLRVSLLAAQKHPCAMMHCMHKSRHHCTAAHACMADGLRHLLLKTDKRYKAPDGRTFQSYDKARAYWEQQKQASGSRKVRKRAESAVGKAQVVLNYPGSVPLLVSWLRGLAAAGLKYDPPEEPGFVRSAERARVMCLQVRSTRTQ